MSYALVERLKTSPVRSARWPSTAATAYRNVLSMDGGWRRWRELGCPVEMD